MGTMGGEDVQFFMAASFVLKRRAAGWERVFLFFFIFFFFLPRAHRIYVYITNNVSLVPQKTRGRNGAITREQDEPFIRIKFLAWNFADI